MPGNSFGESLKSGLAGICRLQAQSERGRFPCSLAQKDGHVTLPLPSQGAESCQRCSQEKYAPSLFPLDLTGPETRRDKNHFCYSVAREEQKLPSAFPKAVISTMSFTDPHSHGQTYTQCSSCCSIFLTQAAAPENVLSKQSMAV